MDFDSDDVGFMFLLPWPIALLVIVIFIAMAIWYASLPSDKRSEMCAEEAAPYGVEGKYDETNGCVVKIDANHWQKIEKYKKSGIIKIN